MAELAGFPVRETRVVWRDVAGEVLIVEEDGTTVRTLNTTAGLIWTLADGTRQMDQIVDAVCDRFDVSPEEALADARAFCTELLEAGLLSLREAPVTK